MAASVRLPPEKAVDALLLAALVMAGLAFVREGPHFDNVVEGWRFFTSAFFSGMIVGFVGWTLGFGVTPQFSLSGVHRRPWLAALVLGIAAASAASYLNRTFATPAGPAIAADIQSLEEGRGDRWHITVKLPDGRYQRYLIPKDAATALQGEKSVRLGVAHGMLGFDFVSEFEPIRP